jgi:hypothetical protein
MSFPLCFRIEIVIGWLVGVRGCSFVLSTNSTFLSEQTSTSHQPPAKRTGWVSRDHGVHEWLVPPLVLVDLLAKDCNQNLI